MVTESESSTETETPEQLVEPVTDSKPWRFQPGQVANPYGRRGNPEKRTMVTEVRRKADRKASKLADALIETALKGNVRAFIAIRDTAYGVPATKLVIEQADSPASELLMRMLASKGLSLPAIDAVNAGTRPAIEASYTEVPGN